MNQLTLPYLSAHFAVHALTVLSFAALSLGAMLAYASRIYPGQQAAFERYGGIMIISGLAMLGLSFPSL
jgi:hypothetical protein